MTAPSSSGLPAVDRQWGGFGPGRAYLLVGRAGAGRSALALQAARAAVDDGQRCLLISPRPPDALVEVGRGVGLDLAAAHAAGRLRLLRIPAAADLAARGPEGLAAAYRDLAGLVAADGPDRVVIEDFTPLVQFDTFDRFHDAFAGLVAALRAQGATLLLGLGDPANDASRQLLDVVEGLVDGSIRLGAGGDLHLGLPAEPAYPSNDGGHAEATPPSAPPAATSEPAAPSAPAEPPTAAEPPAPAEPRGEMAAAAVPPAPTPAPDPIAPPAPLAPAPVAPPGALAPPAAEPDAGFSTTFASADGGTPTAPDAAPLTSAPEAPSEGARGGAPPATEVVPPPPPDPSLLAPAADVFGYDPADALFDQGFLADSTGGRVLGTVGASGAAPAPAGLPSFAPLAGGPVAAPDTGASFRATLEAAFAARAAGTPFQVVAVRMTPGTPQAVHFGAVAAGLRAALGPRDAALVDAARLRAAVVLPHAGPDAAQVLFSGLQAHLRKSLGVQAEPVLQAVAAVTISDGQPFQTAADLIAYAIEQ